MKRALLAAVDPALIVNLVTVVLGFIAGLIKGKRNKAPKEPKNKPADPKPEKPEYPSA